MASQTIPDVAPYWWFIGGMVLLLAFFLIIRPRGFRPYPGPRPYPVPGGGLLGPGGPRRLLGAEGFAGATPRFTMFGVKWCPHCVSAKPVFESMGPTTTIDGQEAIFIDESGYAHTITTPASGLNGTLHILTFGGTVGQAVHLVSRNGKWWTVAVNGVTPS